MIPTTKQRIIQKKTIAKENFKSFNMLYLCASSPKKVRSEKNGTGEGRKTTRVKDKIEST
jgi:hypothetical protein